MPEEKKIFFVSEILHLKMLLYIVSIKKRIHVVASQ